MKKSKTYWMIEDKGTGDMKLYDNDFRVILESKETAKAHCEVYERPVKVKIVRVKP